MSNLANNKVQPNNDIQNNNINEQSNQNISDKNIKTDSHNVIRIRTNDKIIYNVKADILLKSKLLVGLVEDYMNGKSEDDEILELQEVDTKRLELILDYLKHYEDKEPKKFHHLFPREQMKNFLEIY